MITIGNGCAMNGEISHGRLMKCQAQNSRTHLSKSHPLNKNFNPRLAIKTNIFQAENYQMIDHAMSIHTFEKWQITISRGKEKSTPDRPCESKLKYLATVITSRGHVECKRLLLVLLIP
jgi:hypothetical protein